MAKNIYDGATIVPGVSVSNSRHDPKFMQETVFTALVDEGLISRDTTREEYVFAPSKNGLFVFNIVSSEISTALTSQGLVANVDFHTDGFSLSNKSIVAETLVLYESADITAINDVFNRLDATGISAALNDRFISASPNCSGFLIDSILREEMKKVFGSFDARTIRRVISEFFRKEKEDSISSNHTFDILIKNFNE